jgi:quercetin dioxygenase-like cupin family protein
MRARTRGLVQLLGIAGAALAWLGWFQIGPALGFPTIGPAAMVNRVFLPKSDPGVWLGWVLVVIGLVAVAALYAMATARRWIRPGPLPGVLVGLAVWAIAGMIVMVVIGHISPPAPVPSPPPGQALPTTPDPMHATFLMLHLGALAPVEALAAWLLFGAAIGSSSIATGSASAEAAARSRRFRGMAPMAGIFAALVALATAGWIDGPGAALAGDQAPGGAQRRVLATGPAKALPEGAAFVSVIELPQAPGARLGPHAHVPGFAYVLRGKETIAFPGQPTLEVEAGQAGFMGGLAIHTHENKNRLAAAGLAVGLLAIGLALVIVCLARVSARRAILAALSGLLIVAGAVALWDPWVNDWFFIGVRPAAARGGVMPLPDASRIYESPDLAGLSPGPYTESLQILTVPGGSQMTVGQEPGPETFVVLEGQAAIQVNGDAPISLGVSESTLAQEGASVQISNAGDETLFLLSFSVVGAG